MIYPRKGNFIYALRGWSQQQFYKYEFADIPPFPGGTVEDSGQYQTSNNSLSASWYGFADNVGVTGYSYSVYLTDDGTTPLVAATTTASTSFNESFTALADGKTLVVYVQAGDVSGNWQEQPVTSNGITIDANGPTTGTVSDEGQFTTSATTLSASWTGFADTTSGIARYDYSIGTSAGDTSVLAWTSNGTTANVSATGLSLASGTQYFINVRAVDAVGNTGATASTDGITVDATGPTTGTVSDEGQFTASTTTLSASWTGFADATSGIARYDYSIGTNAGDTSVLAWTSNGTATGLSATGLTLTGGQQYFINVRAVDTLGNTSAVASTDGITVDATPPTTGTVSDTGTTTNTGTQLAATIAGFADTTSGIARYDYSIGTSAGDTSVLAWTSNATSTAIGATGLTLTGGQQYFINVRAVDAVGNTSATASTDGITFVSDATAPTTGTVSDEGQFTASATTLSASWTGFADNTAITRYDYSLGTSAGDTSVLAWTSNGTATSVSATGLTLASGTQYFVNVRAVDGVGNTSATTSTDGITVDTAAPTAGTVTDAGTTTHDGTQLTANWAGFADATSGIARYDYSVGTSAGDTGVAAWTSNGTATTLTLTGLTLTDGQTYFVNIRAVDAVGNTSTVASSDGMTFVADTTAPTAGTVNDEGQFTASATTLNASWSGFADGISGIARYDYSIGTSAGDTSVVAWASNGTATSLSATGLNLASGTQYFVNVRAVDGVGNTSAVASSDGITVDATAPTTGTVSDEGDITHNGTQLAASWTGFADAHTGIARYDYSLGTSAGDASVVAWTSIGTATTLALTGLALTDGRQYFINVRAVDGVGNISATASSDGITVDTAAPATGTVADDGQYTSDSTRLSATWIGFGDNIGIDRYEYSIGTSAGDTSVRDWTTVVGAVRLTSASPPVASLTVTGLSLTSGVTYFINLRAKDIAGNTGQPASTDGITVDTDAPTAGTVSDQGTATRDKTRLNASWSGFADAASAVARYDYSIGTRAGDTSVLDWTSAGADTSTSATGLDLAFGTTYFVNVRATDALGHVGSLASSDGIMVITVGGDLNGDGLTNLDDALLANRMAAGTVTPTAAQLLFADVAEPKDGKITTEDANLILRCAEGDIGGNSQFTWCAVLNKEAAALPVQGDEGGAP